MQHLEKKNLEKSYFQRLTLPSSPQISKQKLLSQYINMAVPISNFPFRPSSINILPKRAP